MCVPGLDRRYCCRHAASGSINTIGSRRGRLRSPIDWDIEDRLLLSFFETFPSVESSQGNSSDRRTRRPTHHHFLALPGSVPANFCAGLFCSLKTKVLLIVWPSSILSGLLSNRGTKRCSPISASSRACCLHNRQVLCTPQTTRLMLPLWLSASEWIDNRRGMTPFLTTLPY